MKNKIVTEFSILSETDVEIPNVETRQALDDARKGIGISQAYDSVDALLEALNDED